MQSAKLSFFEMLDQVHQKAEHLPNSAFHTIQEPQYLSWMISQNQPAYQPQVLKGLRIYATQKVPCVTWSQLNELQKQWVEQFNSLANSHNCTPLSGPRSRRSLKSCYRELLKRIHPDHNPQTSTDDVANLISLYRKIDRSVFTESR